MDDDTGISSLFAQVANAIGFEVEVLNHTEPFFERVAAFDPDVLMIDLQMPGSDGIELLRGLGDRHCRATVFIMSGMDTRVLATAEQFGLSLGLKVAGTINKPIDVEPLREILLPHYVQARVIRDDDIESAVDASQFIVHYLPKLSHHGGSRWVLEGAEALVRWEHSEYGLLYPDEFLARVEGAGAIAAVTEKVFRAAMEQVSQWFARGICVDLGLNLATGLLSDIEFPDRLFAMIADFHLDPSMITLELRQTAALPDIELALDILSRLRVKHVNLCLDDFGVGRSSLMHLYRMPFSEVKLDNAFIRDMRTNEDARATVQGLIDLVHKLDIRACAEGVEDAATFRMLEAMGCDRLQGYFIGSAVPAAEFEDLIAEWNEPRTGNTGSRGA